MTTIADAKPLFTDLGQLANTITNAINHAKSMGVKAKAVHINPKMLEIMDQLKGETIKAIGDYPIVADASVPIDRFRLRKW